MPMTSDTLLNACALIELVARQDGDTIALDDHISLIGDAVCDHHRIALYVTGALVNICKDVGFDLTAFINHERGEAFREGGMA